VRELLRGRCAGPGRAAPAGGPARPRPTAGAFCSFLCSPPPSKRR